MRSDLLDIYRVGISEPWLAEVTDVRIVSAGMRTAEIERTLESMNAAYYFRLQLGNFLYEPPQKSGSWLGHGQEVLS